MNAAVQTKLDDLLTTLDVESKTITGQMLEAMQRGDASGAEASFSELNALMQIRSRLGNLGVNPAPDMALAPFLTPSGGEEREEAEEPEPPQAESVTGRLEAEPLPSPPEETAAQPSEAPNGSKDITPKEGYRPYVFRAFCDLGGKSAYRDVQERVRTLMEADGVLKSADLLPSGRTPLARYQTQTANLRTDLKNEGLIEVVNGNQFALTEKGKKEAKRLGFTLAKARGRVARETQTPATLASG